MVPSIGAAPSVVRQRQMPDDVPVFPRAPPRRSRLTPSAESPFGLLVSMTANVILRDRRLLRIGVFSWPRAPTGRVFCGCPW
jgi:hypothetical protein